MLSNGITSAQAIVLDYDPNRNADYYYGAQLDDDEMEVRAERKPYSIIDINHFPKIFERVKPMDQTTVSYSTNVYLEEVKDMDLTAERFDVCFNSSIYIKINGVTVFMAGDYGDTEYAETYKTRAFEAEQKQEFAIPSNVRVTWLAPNEKMQTLDYENEFNATVGDWIRHLGLVFHRNTIDILSIGVLPQSATMGNICKALEGFTVKTTNIYAECSPAAKKSISMLPPTERILFFENEYTNAEQKLLAPPSQKEFIETCDFSVGHFCSVKSGDVKIISNEIEEQKINQFLKEWIEGEHGNIKKLALKFDLKAAKKQLIQSTVLAGTGYTSCMVETNDPPKGLFVDVEVRSGFDICRNDGSMATLLFGSKDAYTYGMEMTVWPVSPETVVLEKRNPLCLILHSAKLCVEGTVIQLCDIKDQQETIILSKRDEFHLNFNFNVQRDFITGLKYTETIHLGESKSEPRTIRLGNFKPLVDLQHAIVDGSRCSISMLHRGTYTVESTISDDAGNVDITWKWPIEIVK